MMIITGPTSHIPINLTNLVLAVRAGVGITTSVVPVAPAVLPISSDNSMSVNSGET